MPTRSQKARRHLVARLVAGRVVDVLEAVEIEQQQRRRLAFGDEVLEQRIAAIEKRAPVGHTGQRVGLRRQPLLEFGTLLRHGDAQKRQAESDEQRFERHHGHDCAVRVPAADRGGQVLRVGDARQKKARMPDHQQQCRPARDQIAVARVPQFARREQRIARADRRNHWAKPSDWNATIHSAGPIASPIRLTRRPSKLRAPHHMKP